MAEARKRCGGLCYGLKKAAPKGSGAIMVLPRHFEAVAYPSGAWSGVRRGLRGVFTLEQPC